MSWLSKLFTGIASPFSRRTPQIEVKALPAPSAAPRGVLSLSVGAGGLSGGQKELLAAAAVNPNLKRVLNVLAQCLAATPFYLVEKRAARGSKTNKAWSFATRASADHGIVTKAAKASGEEVSEHPFLDFLAAGSLALDGAASLDVTYRYRILKGEAFWRLIYSAENKPPVLYSVVPPQWVQACPSVGSGSYEVQEHGRLIHVPQGEMVWFKDPGLVDPYGRGEGIGDALSDELDTDEYAAQLMRSVLANRGFADLIIGIKEPTQEQAELIEAKYNQRQRGVMNAGKALVIDTEKLEVKPITHALSELKLLELREFERKVIAQTFCIPPELLGDTGSSNRATAYQAERIFARHVLLPQLERMRRDLQLKVLPLFDPQGKYLLQFPSPMPEDREYALDVMRAAPTLYTINEWRAQAGKPPLDVGGDALYQPPTPMGMPAIPGIGDAEKDLVVCSGARPETRSAVLTKATGAALSQAEIEQLVQMIGSEELIEKLGPTWQRRMQAEATRQWAALGFEGSFDLINPLISDHLVEFGGRYITLVDNTTRSLVGATLADGVAAGEGISELAKRVRTQMGALQADGYRARLIARTEVVRSANLGRQISWEATALPLRKRYVSALDPDTRDSHRDMHNVDVPLDGSWTYSAALDPFIEDTIQTPGSSAYAGHACNCCCTSVAYDPEHDGKSLDYGSAEHVLTCKAFDDGTRPWEAEMVQEMDRFYRKLEEQLISAMS